jgi:hypothetical protein
MGCLLFEPDNDVPDLYRASTGFKRKIEILSRKRGVKADGRPSKRLWLAQFAGCGYKKSSDSYRQVKVEHEHP